MHRFNLVAVRSASRVLFASSIHQPAAPRRAFSSCIPSGAYPKRLTLSLSRVRTFATSSEEEAPEHEVAQQAAEVAEADSAPQATNHRTMSPGADEPAPSNVLYVGNLYFGVTEEVLKNEFSKFGPVTRVSMPNDIRGMRRGLGYVYFETEQEATAARAAMHMQVLEGRTLNVRYARSRQRQSPLPAGQPSQTLYVGNMSYEISDEDLNNLFREVEGVTDVRVAVDRATGTPRGYAHADFGTIEQAVAASQKLSGMEIRGRRLRTDFSTPNRRQ